MNTKKSEVNIFFFISLILYNFIQKNILAMGQNAYAVVLVKDLISIFILFLVTDQTIFALIASFYILNCYIQQIN